MFMLIAILVLLLFLAMVPHLAFCLVWVVARLFHAHVPYAPFGWATLGLILLVGAAMAYGYFWGRYSLEVTHHEVSSKRLPSSFKDYKIVHLSDLHLGTFLSRPDKLQKVVDSVNALNPDLVCFTGDIVSLGVDEARALAPVLSKIKAKDGVVSVLGNHDLFIYGRDLGDREHRDQLVEQLAEVERNMGWRLLRNEHLVLRRGEDSLVVAGVDNVKGDGQGFQTYNSGDLPKAMQGVGAEAYVVLLSHDPSHWRAEVLDCPQIVLTLSGHTHAAQIRFFGWSPASWMFREVQGLYGSAGQWLYVSRGIGCTLPVRIGCPAEVSEIVLR